MNIQNKTILITGGGSGIGLEIARLLSAQNNKVVLVGRNADRIAAAADAIPNAHFIQADVTKEADVEKLVQILEDQYKDLSVLINNAGAASYYRLNDTTNAYSNAAAEISANYLAPIRLTEKLLPLLKQQPEAAIVNVSSIVAFVPNITIPTYSASKAALHAYTQALRLSLGDQSTIKVFELMPPLVNTDFSEAIGGKERGIPPVEVAQALLDAFRDNNYEIHVGQTAQLRQFFFSSPAEALHAFNNR
ncbi:uncharacterized oxidoreductase [Chitinophaga terrae (ex Kim and Jung 2007)]|jgi:uncharacterized oxidoreductase|uniref:Uncharacterized oxidoreductase n=1 Tax=Chitinophaga terrae (ex Kim and Jung 2007) TaxID=408074 RepID=A0A1H4D2I8_9BACT|nr:SDR family NAD(P)-dependent oxidoreductase [Chitinophaga terrae (ex Kim and Jung 2007)]MDQ0108437.1 putative oxidoreductase [Chitinophaga terrae (ex Kim and Jung 2007)]GEP90608.1 putative oxidoreductase DltE [Chitinophaga terrae (ex Kim and Jung 2007)]SEA66659.1 uncharacterized oxidoreductase [Chitinophaga terrae (ex Kim and Jung 2007)]